MADFMSKLESKARVFGVDIKERINQVAREHNLDPNHVEDWPEEIKKKII